MKRGPSSIFLVSSLVAILSLLLLSLACGGGSSTTNPGTPSTPFNTGTLGSVTVKGGPESCSQVLSGDQGVQGANCYQVTVSCPNVADQDVGVKVSAPAGTSVGTILFTTGGSGLDYYDQHFVFGTQIINRLNAANYAAVQFAWGYRPIGFPGGGTFAGWLTGPGGPRQLACRWATVAKWVHDNPQITSSTAPFCATGNSAGSGVAAYAISFYGEDNMFNMLEETSGPPFSRVDNGCICPATAVQNSGCTSITQPISECYGIDGNMFLDPAYNPLTQECSSVESTHGTANAATFLNDSILASDAKLDYPNVDIHFVFGGQDPTSGVAQGTEYWKKITVKGGGAPVVDCVQDAPHRIGDVADGADKIVNDLVTFCK